MNINLRQYTTILVLVQLYFVRGDMFRLIIQPSSGQLTIERYLIIVRPIWDPTLFTYNVYKKLIISKNICIRRAVKKFSEMWYSTEIVGHMTMLT